MFTLALQPPHDPSPRPIRTQFKRDRITGQYLDIVHPHLPRQIRKDLFAIFKFHPKCRCRQRFNNDSSCEWLVLILRLSRLHPGSHVDIDIRLKLVNSQGQNTVLYGFFYNLFTSCAAILAVYRYGTLFAQKNKAKGLVFLFHLHFYPLRVVRDRSDPEGPERHIGLVDACRAEYIGF